MENITNSINNMREMYRRIFKECFDECLAKIDNLNSDDDVSNFLDDYYETYTGLFLRSKQFLKELNGRW